MRLQDKIALVTGSARGIGFAVAKALAREGAVVVVADINAEGARTAAETIKGLGGRAEGMEVNVGDPASVAAMIRAIIEAHGRIDLLVNNAGVGGSTPFLDTTLEEFQYIVSINLTGAFMVAQGVAKEMVKRGGGKIVNIASLSGQRGGTGRAAYGAAKAGLELLTKVMAVELAQYKINVNNIVPGVIETEMVTQNHDPATRAAYNYLVPFGYCGMPEDIAKAAVFLCSTEADYIHGHSLNVDGGFGTAGLQSGPGKVPPSKT